MTGPFRISAVFGVALMAAAAMLHPADAQRIDPARCGAHDDIRAALSDRFEEKRTSIGLIGDHSLVEVYASPSGTWTILMTRADGNSCIMAAGHSWEQVPVLLGSAV